MDPGKVRPALPARETQCVQEPQDRPGSPRGDPPHVRGERAFPGKTVSQQRPACPLRTDLEPLCRLADDPGGLRPDGRGHSGRQITFRATGSILLFPGFMSLYVETQEENGAKDQEGKLPELTWVKR